MVVGRRGGRAVVVVVVGGESYSAGRRFCDSPSLILLFITDIAVSAIGPAALKRTPVTQEAER